MLNSVISYIIITLGIVFMTFGIIGIFRFKNFYSRILITSKIETVGFITVMAGIIVKSGVGFFSLKILLIIVLFMLSNPLSTHAIGRSAFISRLFTEDHRYD